MPKFAAEVLIAVLRGLELQKAGIEEKIASLQSQLRQHGGPGRRPASQTPASPGRKRGPLSPAARKRIAAAQKKRWAEFRKQKAAS